MGNPVPDPQLEPLTHFVPPSGQGGRVYGPGPGVGWALDTDWGEGRAEDAGWSEDRAVNGKGSRFVGTEVRLMHILCKE